MKYRGLSVVPRLRGNEAKSGYFNREIIPTNYTLSGKRLYNEIASAQNPKLLINHPCVYG